MVDFERAIEAVLLVCLTLGLAAGFAGQVWYDWQSGPRTCVAWNDPGTPVDTGDVIQRDRAAFQQICDEFDTDHCYVGFTRETAVLTTVNEQNIPVKSLLEIESADPNMSETVVGEAGELDVTTCRAGQVDVECGLRGNAIVQTVWDDCAEYQ